MPSFRNWVRGLAATLALVTASATPAAAYDPAKAGRYPSYDMFRPEADRITIHGPGSTGPIEGMSVLPPGSGAVPRPLGQKLPELGVSVRDYGPPGKTCVNGANGSDDTAAFYNAINAVIALGGSYGGTIRVPGICVISSAIIVPKSKSISFVGDGPGSSVIRQTNPAADGIVYDNGTANSGDADYLVTGQNVRNLTIEAGAGFTASKFFGQGSSGTGLKFIHGNNGSGSINLNINNFAGGLALLSTWETVHVNLHVSYHSGNAVLVDKGPDGVRAGGNRIIGARLGNGGFEGDKSNSVSIRVRSSGGEYFTDVDATGAQTGVLVDPRAGDQVAYLWFTNVLGDSSIGDCWHLDGTNGYIVALRAVNSWGGYCGGNGLVTEGQYLSGFSSTNMALRENMQRGWWNKGGTGLDLVNPDISHNSRTADGGPNTGPAYPGVEIADKANDWSIVGGRIGNQESGGAYQQAEAIKFAGASAGFRVVGVDMRRVGANASPIGGFDETKLLQATLTGNLPRASYGVNWSERQGRTVADVLQAGGRTVYLGANGARPQANLTAIVAEVSELISRVDVQIGTPPGAGESFTYQAVVNGAPTGPTLTISGTSVFQGTFYPGATLSPGDTFEIAVTQSANAAGGAHRASISLDR